VLNPSLHENTITRVHWQVHCL